MNFYLSLYVFAYFFSLFVLIPVSILSLWKKRVYAQFNKEILEILDKITELELAEKDCSKLLVDLDAIIRNIDNIPISENELYGLVGFAFIICLSLDWLWARDQLVLGVELLRATLFHKIKVPMHLELASEVEIKERISEIYSQIDVLNDKLDKLSRMDDPFVIHQALENSMCIIEALNEVQSTGFF
jgi:hypothetical protein